MANIGTMLGFGGGGTTTGTDYQATGFNITPPATQEQANQAYGQSQMGLTQQQAFLNALVAQGGVGNQQGVFNQQQALANQMATLHGVQNQNDVFNQAKGLSGQYQNIANGQGPNPAQAQLAQATGANTANQAALMAGQRGAGANVGLMARQAAMQGAATQQQAAGQAATLEAQQRLAALGQMQGQQQLMGALSNQQVGQQQAQQGQLANLSTQQVGQQAGGINNYNQAAQSEQQALLGSLGNTNAQNISMQSNMNNANSGVQGITAQNQGKLQGGLLSGVSSLPALLAAHGGMVPKYDNGGAVGGPTSFAGRFLTGFSNGMTNGMGISSPDSTQNSSAPNFNDLSKSGQQTGMNIAKGIANIFSPSSGEQGGSGMSSMANTMMMNKGGKIMKSGGKVPGTAKVAGDNLKNDTQAIEASPGEIVLPRSITMGKNAPMEAAKFVAAILARKGMRYAI